jgi:putative oligomerization/nucleic acid binding protein
VRRVGASRNQLVGVLVRPPCSGSALQGWADLVIDPIEQIEELADLRHRGLLTAEEFERQKAKVFRP